MRFENCHNTKTRLFLCTSLFFWALTCHQAFAGVYQQPKSGAKPLKEERTGMTMYVVVVSDNCTFLTSPDNAGKPLANPPGYLDVLTVYQKTVGDDFFLVKKSNVDEYGWIPKKDLITSRFCLQSEDESNPAYLKVAIKNNWRTSDGRKIQDIPIYSGPGENYKQIGIVTIFNIRYAFVIQGGQDNAEFVFVGNDFMWDRDSPARTLTGWVKRDYCILWDSRIGVYYNKDNISQRSKVAIFKNQPDLIQFLKNGNSGKAIAIESGTTGELRYDTTRFPVLETDRSDGNREMVKIAFVGDAEHKKTGKLMSDEEIGRRKNDFYRSANQIRDKDILFLIDATKSMGPYFDAARNAVMAFVTGLSKNEKSRFRFGLGIYRDYPDGKEAFMRIAPLQETETVQAMQSSLAKSSANDRDYPEAVFNGIIKGVESVQWRNGIRAVVVIGDHGNHEPDPNKYSERSVASILQRKRISFYSINVNVREHWKHYNLLFQRQMASINSLNRSEGLNPIITTTGKFDADETSRVLISALQDVYRHSDSLALGLIDLSEGKSMREIETKYGTRVTNYMRRIMKEFGLSDDEINLAVWSQVCDEGWVSKKTPKGRVQLVPWCFMTRTELEDLVGFLGNVLKLADVDPRRVKSMVQTIVHRASGDKIREKELISEYLQRRLHIPFREVSEVLQHTPTGLQNKFIEDAAFRIRFKKQLGQKLELQRFVTESKIGKLSWDQSRNVWQKSNIKDKEWWVTTKSGESYAWIPMAYLP